MFPRTAFTDSSGNAKNRSVVAQKRPIERTRLYHWLQEANISYRRFALMVGTTELHVGYWAQGRVVPSIVYAFRVELLTKGGVPASSWLDTTLARSAWNLIEKRAKLLTIPVPTSPEPVQKANPVPTGRVSHAREQRRKRRQ